MLMEDYDFNANENKRRNMAVAKLACDIVIASLLGIRHNAWLWE